MQSEESEVAIRPESLIVDCCHLPVATKAHPIWQLHRATDMHCRGHVHRTSRLPLAAAVATPAGLEPATCRLEGGRSIQLSYGADY